MTRPEGAAPREELELTRREFDALLEYSGSLPTGTTIGKRWKKNPHAFSGRADGSRTDPAQWLVGEYHDVGDERRVGVRWYRVKIKDESPPAPVPAPAEGRNINPHVLRDALIFWLQQHPNERGSAYEAEVRRCLEILEEEIR